jgi:rare lipoprotein A (peptidoglycan hydrolase)
MKLKLIVSLTLTAACATAAVLGGRAATTPQAKTYSDQLIHVQEVHLPKVVTIPARVVHRPARRPRVVARATRSYRRPAPVYQFSGATHYGRASWYTGGYGACGRALTGYYAASRTLPCGSHVLVSYGGHSVVVTILDRGPQSTLRDLDLSRSAFEELAPTSKGVIWVHWRLQ